MSSELIEVFVGAPLEDPTEAHTLARLRADLAAAGVRARIHANFVAGRRGKQRQIDFLIALDHRLVQAELKTLDPALAVSARKNGRWEQTYRDGTFKVLDNYYEQASQATFAVNDSMEDLARAGEVPRHASKYVKDIDSIILLAPKIPAGSHIERRDHMTVVGYDHLLDRLVTPGPRPAWTAEHWDAFARHLGLYQPDPESNPEERARREVLDKARDYRTRFIASMADRDEYVPISGSADDGHATDLRPPVLAALRSGGSVTVEGVSGSGKSHLAKHISVALAEQGLLPFYIRCRDYHGGHLPDLIRGAAARFTVEKAVEFIDRSNAAGVPSVLILDGLNESDDAHRELLLSRLAEFRLRHPAAVLITSTSPIASSTLEAPLAVQLPLPSREERTALFLAYGVEPNDDLLQFERPFEIAIAAEVHQELAPGAPRGVLYDAYIRRSADEVHRTALRRLARFLHAELRSSLSTGEAGQILRAVGTTADVIDETLGSPLIDSSRNRLSFSHELVGQYLAAESLILDHPDTPDLVAAAADPANSGLEEFMLACEPQPQRRHAILRTPAGSIHLPKSARGTYGHAVRELVRKDIRDALEAATLETIGAHLVADEYAFPTRHRWEIPDDADQLRGMLLATAWQMLKTHGEFAAEFVELFDVTDEIIEREISRLREEGVRNPINIVVASTLGSGFGLSGLPVTPLLSGVPVFWDRVPVDVHALQAVWQPRLELRAWTRIMAGLRLLEGGIGDALATAPDLTSAAWKTGVSVIRLEALLVAKTVARNFEHATRLRMQATLDGITPPEDIWLSSALVEALAANGGLEPMKTKDDLLDEVRNILSAPDDLANKLAAQHMFSSQYDPAEVVGPYSEALDSLTVEDRARLAIAALTAERDPVVAGPELLRIVVDALPVGDPAVATRIFSRYAARRNFFTGMVQDQLAMHLFAVRGLAVVGAPLPEAVTGDGKPQPAWDFVDRALYAVYAPNGNRPTARAWSAMYGDLAPALLGVSSLEVTIAGTDDAGRPHLVRPHFDALTTEYADEVRSVLELAIANPSGISESTWPARTGEVEEFAISMLADMGDAESIGLLRPALEGERAVLVAKSIRAIERRLNLR